MKSLSQTIAVGIVGLLVGGSALASDRWLGDQGDNWQQHVTSTKTRTQVIDELTQARIQGDPTLGRDVQYPQTTTIKNSRTREAVRADVASPSANAAMRTMYSGGQ